MSKPIDFTQVNADMDGYGALELMHLSIERDLLSLELKSPPEHEACVRHLRIECHQMTAFRIASRWIEYVEVSSDPARFVPLAAAKHTYVIVGESVNWPSLLGELVQRFGDVEELIEPQYMRETIEHADYRLPVTVPASQDESLRRFLDSRAVQYFPHHVTPASSAREALFFGWRPRFGFVLANRFSAIDLL